MRRRGLGPQALLALVFAAVVAAQTEDLPVTPEEPWNIEAKTSNAMKDSAGTHIFSFEHDVVITHGDLTANADAARYLEAVSRALLSGNVVMRQQGTTALGPSAVYDRVTRVARFPEGLVIERPTGTAVADEGIWERDRDLFELRGNASAADTAATVEAQSMTYDVAADIFHARGDAEVVDRSNGMRVRGGLLEYDRRQGMSRATRSPEAEFTEEGEHKPVRVFGDLLNYDPRADIAVAVGNVRILRDSIEAVADSATFYRNESRALLVGSPKMVDGPTEISGERMEILEIEPGKRRVIVEGSASIHNRFEIPPAADSASASAAIDSAAALADSALARAAAPLDSIARAPGVVDSAVARMSAITDSIVARVLPDSAFVPPDSLLAQADSAIARAGSLISRADSVGADTTAASADSAAADTTPKWIKTPGDKLPVANLLFGDRMVLDFENNELARVEVTGHARSKFYPDEKKDLGEWNDVAGDSLHAWFTQSELDSVTVLGNGSGEYRMGAGPKDKDVASLTTEQLLEQGRIVRYRAPRIRYQHQEERMHLDQGSEVEYKGMILKAGTIEFDSKKEVLDASGDPPPTLVDKKDQISGEEMRYHLGTRTGEILLGRTRFENGFYSGKEVWRLNDEVLAIHDAAFTTCDLASPHFHFTSNRMKIYPEDKIVAKPIVLRIRDIPVLALPFYTASLVRDRHSGFLIPNLELGVDDERGRFIRKVGYYWVPNDYTDLTASFDFYPEQERFVGYLSGRYALRYKFNGRAEVKYNRDVPANSRDTAFEFDHRQTFSETAELTASGSFLSSSSIYRDIDDSRRLDRDIRSHATLNKRFINSNQSLRAELERRENLDTGEIHETLPIIQYSLPSRTFGGQQSNLYYGSDARFVHVRDRFASGTEEEHTGSRIGADLRSTVSLQPYARITPSITAEGVWQDEDREGDPNAFRGTFSTNVGATSTMYGTFLKKMGPITGIRHVFEPSASWQWAPEFENYFFTDSTGTRVDRFFSFGGIGGTPLKTNRGSFSLRNLIQSKFLRGEQEQRYDVFSFRHSISYDFLAHDLGGKPWSNLTSSLNVLSSLPINQTWSVNHDVYSGDIVNTSVSTQMRINSSMFKGGVAETPQTPEFATPPAEFEKHPTDTLGAPTGTSVFGDAGSWTLDASHSFQRGGQDSYSSFLVLGTSWVPTPKWRVTFNTQYDLKSGENTAQQWSVHRTIHCWELSFDRRLLGGEWQYYFRINVTQLPDIQAERGDRITGRSGLPLEGLGGF